MKYTATINGNQIKRESQADYLYAWASEGKTGFTKKYETALKNAALKNQVSKVDQFDEVMKNMALIKQNKVTNINYRNLAGVKITTFILNGEKKALAGHVKNILDIIKGTRI